jgi:hypothetical protein
MANSAIYVCGRDFLEHWKAGDKDTMDERHPLDLDKGNEGPASWATTPELLI